MIYIQIDSSFRIFDVEMTTIVRIKRQNGEIVQDCDVYIGRACFRGGWELKQSKWHNPFKLGQNANTIEEILELYRAHVLKSPHLMKTLHELRGKCLGCWCKPGPCHGDVLIELINEYY